MFQPSASETRYALSSRPASVPSGKSHNGASPAIGLYTQCACRSPRCASQRNVALLAERIRPMTVTSPRRNTSQSSGSRLGVGVIVGSGDGTAPVAVGAHADMTLGIQGLVAQRAGRPAVPKDPVAA